MSIRKYLGKRYWQFRDLLTAWRMKLTAPFRERKVYARFNAERHAGTLKLHLGCGNIRIPGFINVDILQTSAVDLRDDISTLRKIPDNSVDLIYACHVLEHFSHSDVLAVLKRWHAVLKPGAEMRISVPDIDRIVDIYKTNWQHFQTPANSPWIGLIYGGQGDPYDFHKTGFNFCWMKYLLEGIGFEDIKEYSHEPHFVAGVTDASLSKEPFGEFLSLNVVCKKSR